MTSQRATRRVRRRMHGYMLHLFDADGMSRTSPGDYPTREMAESMGATLQSMGAVVFYSVEACDHEGFLTAP